MSAPATIRLRKAARVAGKTLAFRNAEVKDAAFILSLHTDAEEARHLSAVSGELAEQEAWLESYAGADDRPTSSSNTTTHRSASSGSTTHGARASAGARGFRRATAQAKQPWNLRMQSTTSTFFVHILKSAKEMSAFGSSTSALVHEECPKQLPSISIVSTAPRSLLRASVIAAFSKAASMWYSNDLQ